MLNLKNKRVLIIGFGAVGLSAYTFLKKAQAKVFVSDDNAKALSKIHNDEVFAHDFHEIDFVLKSPGVPTYNTIYQDALKSGAYILTEVELFLEFKDKNTKLIAITGTNGKSTTTAMVTHVLEKSNFKAKSLGNFGVPMLNFVHGLDFAVVELSSYQLENVNKPKFDSSAILNITIDHIEHHKTFDKYKKAKANILNSDNIVLNKDDKNLDDFIIKFADFNIKTFSAIDENASVFIKDRSFIVDGTLYDLSSKSYSEIKSAHSLKNAAAAYLLVSPFISIDDFLENIKSFKNLEHRLENAGSIKNITFINDSKATNAESTIPALMGVENIYWLAGGLGKEGGIVECLPFLDNVKKTYLFGQSRQAFADSLEKYGKVKNVDFIIKETLEEVLKIASDDVLLEAKNNQTDDFTVLLSPAAASLDQFKSFEQRGDKFKSLVHNIIKHNKN